MLNKESCKSQIDAVYQPHYDHFKEYFGTTFMGFFSDEPGFLELMGTYQHKPGKDRMYQPFAWRDDLPELIAESAGITPEEARLLVPSLWEDLNEKTSTFRMHYIIDGNVILHVDGKKYKLRKNHVFYLHPDIEMGYQSDPKNPASYYWISFTGTNVEYYLEKMGLMGSNYLFVPSKWQKPLHRAFYDNFTVDDNVENLKDVIFSENFMKIVQILSISANTAPIKRKHKPKKRYVERAIEIINKRYMDPTFSIREVAEELFLHENYFSKLFKKETKLTFNAYLSRFRFEMSTTLIDQGVSSVAELAFAVGFSDPLYFSKVFKKYNLCSPREEIQRIREKKNAENNPK
jgi:AraC-like DNA-binding protein